MSSEEVVNLAEVTLGNPFIEVSSATIAPVNERSLHPRSLELRRCLDPTRVYVQIGPMRYEVNAEQLVDLVNRAFPYAASQVKDVFMGRFEIRATREAAGEAVRRAFHALHRLCGAVPKRITTALDLAAEVSGVNVIILAERPEIFGCELNVDAMAETIVIDYGAGGFPFTVTIYIVDDAAAT